MRNDTDAGAGVAELADALDSKSSDRKIVWVRSPPPACSCAHVLRGKIGCYRNKPYLTSSRTKTHRFTFYSSTVCQQLLLGPVAGVSRSQSVRCEYAQVVPRAQLEDRALNRGYLTGPVSRSSTAASKAISISL